MKTITLMAAIGLAVTPVCTEHKLQKEISPGFCQQLVEHKPEADVAYEGGVDVHGKPVVEADLNPSPVKIPENLSFNVTVDMAKYLGVGKPEGVEGLASLGTISVEDGKLFFNGQPMEGEAAANLRKICDTPPPNKDKPVSHNKD